MSQSQIRPVKTNVVPGEQLETFYLTHCSRRQARFFQCLGSFSASSFKPAVFRLAFVGVCPCSRSFWFRYLLLCFFEGPPCLVAVNLFRCCFFVSSDRGQPRVRDHLSQCSYLALYLRLQRCMVFHTTRIWGGTRHFRPVNHALQTSAHLLHPVISYHSFSTFKPSQNRCPALDQQTRRFWPRRTLAASPTHIN